MNRNFIHKLIAIIAFAGIVLPANALSYEQTEAKKAVQDYYSRLQKFANNPNDFGCRLELISLFSENGNWVYNDLYEIEGGLINQNKDGDIDMYLGTIMKLWNTDEVKLQIEGVIDEKSFVEENDPDFKDVGKKVVWVTASKYITVRGRRNPAIKETFKVKDGQIQRISTPETSTAFIDALSAYNRGDYEKAYYGFQKQIDSGIADNDTYFYLGLMFRKGKKVCRDLYPSHDLRDKICAFYWMKCWRGQEALYYFGVRTYHVPDYKSFKKPFSCGLMVVYKGEGTSYGYMNEKGKLVIPYRFKKAYGFDERTKTAIVETSYGSWGLIRTDGSYAIKPSNKSMYDLEKIQSEM